MRTLRRMAILRQKLYAFRCCLSAQCRIQYAHTSRRIDGSHLFTGCSSRKGVAMRIAYLTQSYSQMVSGAAIFAEQLAKEMAKRGHQVLVIAASEKEQPYIVQEENLTVLRLASIHNPMRVGQRFLLYPRRAVLQALQEFCPDVIHTHDPLQMGSLGIKYAQRVNIPVTLTTHQLPWFVAKYLPDVLGVRKLTEVILCKSMGIEKRVHFPGYISTKQGLHEIYRMANLFVTASEIETQGIVLLEAAASGLPIVAVHATCIPEIVHDEVNGYLIEPNNIDAMSEAMKKILKDSGIAKSMAKESRKLAEKKEPQVTFYEH